MKANKPQVEKVKKFNTTQYLSQLNEDDLYHLTELSNWFVKEIETTSNIANEYAAKLIDNKITTINKLMKKLMISPKLLSTFEIFDEVDCDEIYEKLVSFYPLNFTY